MRLKIIFKFLGRTSILALSFVSFNSSISHTADGISLTGPASPSAVHSQLTDALSINPQQSERDSDLEQRIVDLEKQSWEAWKKRDGKFFQEFLADDHVEVGANGIATKAQVVKFVGSSACTVKSYSVDRFKLVKLDRDIALLTYHAEQDTLCYEKPVPSPAWVSSLYVRRNGRWQNALYQQTPSIQNQ